MPTPGWCSKRWRHSAPPMLPISTRRFSPWRAPRLASVSAAALERLFKSQPEEVRRAAVKLAKRLERETLKERERLAEFEPLLAGGDAGGGRLVFFGVKAACSACHTVENAGGK